MPLLYATADDLTTYLGKPGPDNADALLRTASLRVREATRTAVYDATSAGLPSDPDVAEAFRDATCAHAAALSAAGIDPSTGGLLTTPGVRASKSVGSASVSYADAGHATAGKVALSTALCPDAVSILAEAGVLTGSAWVVG